jgi:hypothetical protein
MNLDLVSHQRFVCKLNGLLQQGCGEIRDSDMFGSAIAFSLAQNSERLLERHFRIWPMDEEKIDPGELQLFEALIERALDGFS